MLTSREKIILLHVILNQGSVKINFITDLLNVSERTIRRSVEIINSFLKKDEIDAASLSIVGSDLVILGSYNHVLSLIPLNDVYILSKEEIFIIIANQLLFSHMINISAFCQYYKLSKSQFLTYLNELKNILIKQDMYLKFEGSNVFLSDKTFVTMKRLQLELLKKYFVLYPVQAFVDFEKYVPTDILMIINSWLFGEKIHDKYDLIRKLFKNEGLMFDFFDILYITLIFILWKDFRNNSKILISENSNIKSLLKKYKLLDYEKEIINRYATFLKVSDKKKMSEKTVKIMTMLKKIYQPFSDDRINSVFKDVQLLLAEGSEAAVKLPFSKKAIKNENINLLVEGLVEIGMSPRQSVTLEIAKVLYYWLHQQILIDPLKILFINNSRTTISNYTINLINNAFCCGELDFISIYECNHNLLNEHDVIVSEIYLEAIPELLYIEENFLLEDKSVVHGICELMIKKHLKNLSE